MIDYSVILPVFNEEKVITNCLSSLVRQTVYRRMEIIVIDDGSIDGTKERVRQYENRIILLEQHHQGPGAARNFGASKARGKILVFVDADMEFEPDFIEKLVAPMLSKHITEFSSGKVIGTFSKEEYLLNKDNLWSRLWNINQGREAEKMIPDNYGNFSPVFRAIRKSEFDKVGGFDTDVGYTDDWSLSRKLGVMAVVAPGAKYYHRNPETLAEVWTQARWVGKNEFLTKGLVKRILNLGRYFPLWAIFKLPDVNFVIFKFVYNCAVFTSVLLSFFGERKYK